MVNRRVRNAVLECNLKNDRVISVRCQGKPFITVIQVCAPTSNAEEAEQPRQHIKKQTLLCQQRSVESKVWFFPVVMYGCESWTIKKTEHWRIDAFELWCWRRLLRVPWTARRSNQSILKEISLENSLEGLMLKLKLQYLGHLWRTDSLEKDPAPGKDWRWEERGMTEDEMVGWHHQLNGHEFE